MLQFLALGNRNQLLSFLRLIPAFQLNFLRRFLFSWAIILIHPSVGPSIFAFAFQPIKTNVKEFLTWSILLNLRQPCQKLKQIFCYKCYILEKIFFLFFLFIVYSYIICLLMLFVSWSNIVFKSLWKNCIMTAIWKWDLRVKFCIISFNLNNCMSVTWSAFPCVSLKLNLMLD